MNLVRDRWNRALEQEGVSTKILDRTVQTHRESCLTNALSAWMSLASIKYLEDNQVMSCYSY
jgi:hypothetical protein